MDEFKRKAAQLGQVVENTLAATVKDVESGIAAFFTGGHARTHEPEPVKESHAPAEQAQGQDVTTSGTIVASQDMNGTPCYLVEAENPQGQKEKILFEKGDTNYQHGSTVSIKWGDEYPKSAEVESGVQLSWSSPTQAHENYNDGFGL